MTIEQKVEKIRELVGEVSEELEKYRREDTEDEEADNTELNKIQDYLFTVSDAIEDFEDTYNDFKDNLDSDHEEYYFNYDYNGVSQKDFYEVY